MWEVRVVRSGQDSKFSHSVSVLRLSWHIFWWIQRFPGFPELWTITTNPFYSISITLLKKQTPPNFLFLQAWANHGSISCFYGIEQYNRWILCRSVCTVPLSRSVHTVAWISATLPLSSFPGMELMIPLHSLSSWWAFGLFTLGLLGRMFLWTFVCHFLFLGCIYQRNRGVIDNPIFYSFKIFSKYFNLNLSWVPG